MDQRGRTTRIVAAVVVAAIVLTLLYAAVANF
ncbi:hypothetical protein SAMN05216188_1214 [Lentzea xinjiangensis]|uniref:Uncharacterized protein n=1 Tax=Lentzea xinjiangensis TaxID=402600 RepID=A0A1H9UBV2_9PSEU|nr:hypothetical protein SAMN05216188_1214 [Lentzea xinjiangensis]